MGYERMATLLLLLLVALAPAGCTGNVPTDPAEPAFSVQRFAAKGNLIGTNSAGAWESGVDGAQPGIIMWAAPAVGQSYRQEFYEGEAEDIGVVLATGVTVVLSDGTTYTNCLKTLDTSTLDPAALEYKTYAPGVGVVLEEPLNAPNPVELVDGP